MQPLLSFGASRSKGTIWQMTAACNLVRPHMHEQRVTSNLISSHHKAAMTT